MRIFIAGCARSGTSLTRNLMRCFDDTFVHDVEAPVELFAELDRPEPHLIIKRTASCHITLPALPDGIGLIYCVRHPFDTLTSSNRKTQHLRRFHVTEERWRDEYAAFQSLRRKQPQRRIFVSRYEDLVGAPDVTQARLAETFGLTPLRPFSAAPDITIVTTSVEKWKRDPELLTYVNGMPRRLLRLLPVFCEEFAYQLPAPGAQSAGIARTISRWLGL